MIHTLMSFFFLKAIHFVSICQLRPCLTSLNRFQHLSGFSFTLYPPAASTQTKLKGFTHLLHVWEDSVALCCQHSVMFTDAARQKLRKRCAITPSGCHSLWFSSEMHIAALGNKALGSLYGASYTVWSHGLQMLDRADFWRKWPPYVAFQT